MQLFELILLQAPPGGEYIQFLFLGGMILVLYLFIIRPQAKKQKQQNSFLSDLAEGDKVVTSSGIVGKISKIEKGMIVLDIGAGTKTSIKILKSAISKEMTDATFNAEE